ncbi:hypothetical protein [Streptomyces sp. NPDC059468]|uniref:hypothetical protein n=1 Tax=Streptomyces sp. NPDC059468 TaxID=3346845 RepID=UPI0036C136DB
MTTWIIIGITVLYSLTLIFAAWCAIELRAKLDRTTDELIMTRSRLRKTEQDALALVEKVTPLIEQTDWMTGRWHGAFQTLVSMEAKRNAAVVAARQAMWKIPLVADHIKNAYGESK